MQIQKRHVSRGPQPIQNARFGPSRFHLLGFPGLHRNRGTFHKKFLNAFESEVPLEVEFPEDMFFFLGDQGTLLVKNGGGVYYPVMYSVYVLHKAYITSHEIKITNPYGLISMYNLKCQ